MLNKPPVRGEPDEDEPEPVKLGVIYLVGGTGFEPVTPAV